MLIQRQGRQLCLVRVNVLVIIDLEEYRTGDIQWIFRSYVSKQLTSSSPLTISFFSTIQLTEHIWYTK